MKPSEHFAKMVEKIDRNSEETFGGAIVIVPPNGEDVWAWLNITEQPDLALFYAAVQTKVKGVIDAIEEKMRNRQAFGGRM